MDKWSSTELAKAAATCGRCAVSSWLSRDCVVILYTFTVAEQRQLGRSTSYTMLRLTRSMKKSITWLGCCRSASSETTCRLNVPLRLCNVCSTATITTHVFGSIHTEFTFCNAVSRPSTNGSLTAKNRPLSSRPVVAGKCGSDRFLYCTYGWTAALMADVMFCRVISKT